jgi:riboflavin synthase
MFTGLVREIGTIAALDHHAELRRIAITCTLPVRELELGASVCCAGVCLTVVESSAGRFVVEAAFETLRRTTLGALAVGDPVNLEPSLRVGDALGGHFVSGHVDGVGSLRSRVGRGTAEELWFDVPPELLRLCAAKGSLAIDGTSLTVNAVDERGVMVGLIPHTLAVTTLGTLRPGDAVNLEVDMLARYVARLLEGHGGATTLAWSSLVDAGFPGADAPHGSER